MYTDLFSALLNRENRRGHPILSAMLYGFCPAAARWWTAGADPQPPFDPVWQAIKDWDPEISLTERLTQYGLGDALDVVKKYVVAVDKYRFQHRNVLAPELLPFFSGGEFPLNRRFGSENGIQNLGGDWKNLFIYARTWAFLLEDWRSGIVADQDTDYSRKVETVLLTLPDYRQPVHFEALVWRVRTGHVIDARISALVRNGEQDLLRLTLLGLSNPQGDHPWPNLPLVYAMNPETGEAKLADRPISNRELPVLVKQLAKAAQEGPYPPLTALQRPSACKRCGYQNLCYHNSDLVPHLLSEK
jgi:hypothetical protein